MAERERQRGTYIYINTKATAEKINARSGAENDSELIEIYVSLCMCIMRERKTDTQRARQGNSVRAAERREKKRYRQQII